MLVKRLEASVVVVQSVQKGPHGRRDAVADVRLNGCSRQRRLALGFLWSGRRRGSRLSLPSALLCVGLDARDLRLLLRRELVG